jgi:Protein of unknown function (DUF3551)
MSMSAYLPAGACRGTILRAVLMLGAVIVLAALDARAPARAEGLWCASVQGPDGGYVSYGYASWQQCQAALSGQGGICHRNPGGGARPRRDRGG